MSVKVLLPDSWSLYPESSFVKKKNAISNTSHGEGAAYSNPSLQNFQELLVNIMKFGGKKQRSDLNKKEGYQSFSFYVQNFKFLWSKSSSQNSLAFSFKNLFWSKDMLPQILSPPPIPFCKGIAHAAAKNYYTGLIVKQSQ